jgi:hypothetical protein
MHVTTNQKKTTLYHQCDQRYFVGCENFVYDKYECNIFLTISAKIQPRLHTSTGVE